jgi:hypothetical protein
LIPSADSAPVSLEMLPEEGQANSDTAEVD